VIFLLIFLSIYLEMAKGDQRRRKNVLLWELANKQQPSPTYKEAGGAATAKILDCLHKSEEFNVDRGIVAGSIGKKTALGDEMAPDYDLVLFLNNQTLPIKADVLEK
jgi:hypothetical protein